MERFEAQMAALRRDHLMEKIGMLKAMRKRFGDEALKTAEAVEGENVLRKWQAIARESEKSGIEDLIKVLWEPMRIQMGLEYTCEKTPDGFQMRCTKCPFANLASDWDAQEEIFSLICSCDPVIAESFNPDIALRRTKTLVQGDECCDHFYFLRK